MGTKAEVERAIFKAFAEVCPLPIDVASIESREPPEPDILCSLTTGEHIAFELVEVLDQDLAAALNSSIQLPRLLKRHSPPLPGLDSGARVGVIFGDKLSRQETINLFPVVFEQLKQVPVGFAGRWPVPLSVRRKGVHRITIYRRSADELEFIVTPATSIGDPSLDQLKKKFGKPYSSEHPLELLVYYWFQPCMLDEEFGPDLAQAVACGIHASPFRRAWAFDRGSGRIWEYPGPI